MGRERGGLVGVRFGGVMAVASFSFFVFGYVFFLYV